MLKRVRPFWVFFAISIFLGASFLMVGLANAEQNFVAEDEVDVDAPALDPFVVYEWAASGSSCGVSEQLLGAVAHAASDHGLLEGHSYSATGVLTPSLYGESADGSRPNLATLVDSDFGAIDDDEVWDRPVGPFQLLPISWRLYGGDANKDGIEDPQNLWDSAAAAAEFLCQMGAGETGDDVLAVRSYTGSDRLTQRVLQQYRVLLEQQPSRSPADAFDDPDSDIEEGEQESLFRGLEGEDDVLVGDWNADGVATELSWEVAENSQMTTSSVAIAIPLDENGRPYGSHVRVEVSPAAEPFVGDWNGDGFESVAIRQSLDDETDVVEFYNRFGETERDVVLLDQDESIEEVWDLLQAERLEDELNQQTSTVLSAQSFVAASGEELDLERVNGILVNASIAESVADMIEHAREDGVELTGWGWRSNERQIELRIQNCEDPWETPSSECSPPTARPGRSRHEIGLAIDFHVQGRAISRLDPAFVWLEQHAGTYGLFNLPSEPWHWSVDGR